MFSFFRAKTQKDFCDKLLGKTRNYRLSRHGAAVALTGRLLAYYRREAAPDELMPPAAGRVERLGILLSASGRFVICYAVSYPETEGIAGRQEYVHACVSLDAVRDFLSAMHYPGKAAFVGAVLGQAAKTLAGSPHTAALATETRCQQPIGGVETAMADAPESGTATGPSAAEAAVVQATDSPKEAS